MEVWGEGVRVEEVIELLTKKQDSHFLKILGLKVLLFRITETFYLLHIWLIFIFTSQLN